MTGAWRRARMKLQIIANAGRVAANNFQNATRQGKPGAKPFVSCRIPLLLQLQEIIGS